MRFKSSFARLAAAVIAPSVYAEQQNATAIQQKIFRTLLAKGTSTDFGKEHSFASIKTYEDFKAAVKIRDYEGLSDYIDLIADGKENVLWQGKPLYFCKSSGTTSGTKYIPVTKEQIDEMIKAARNSLMLYVAETGKADFFNYPMIFLQGSPALDVHGKIPAGRLSGIVYHHVPFYARANRMPSYDINCIDDWETKVEAIARETLQKKMSLISGIPPWVVMYFEKLQQLSGKQFIKDIFPQFQLFAHGGVNYEPYRNKIESLIGFKIETVETYPASEGFIAFQDSQQQKGLLLNVNSGIFYEFVKAEEIFLENPKRISLVEVELNVNYAIILNTTAGLWAYNLGDTVKFVSLQPYRIVVTGRVKHFISAFGEHVIAEEIEHTLLFTMREIKIHVTEFTVAPQVNPTAGLPYHEWLIEFAQLPAHINAMAELMDKILQQKNSYYRDLRKGHVLQQLKITPLKTGSFVEYMKQQGKLGGQNKVPRLTNNRLIADAMLRLQSTLGGS